MANDATGTVEKRNGRWYARLTIDGQRRRIALPENISEAKARELALALAERASDAAKAPKGEA